ncbi:septum site-determining protein Ssd [Dactylosporangium sp. NPDC051541]|uniref:septum site-determining protein Ssd n=1 Tax=Dactylosporangium sp. NPDC051541 TaxID=3363977 RepID=UPI0037AAC590
MQRPLFISADSALRGPVEDLAARPTARPAARPTAELDVAPGADDVRHRYRPAPLLLRGGSAVQRRGRLAAIADDIGAEPIARTPEGAAYLANELRRLTTVVRGRILAVIGGRGGAGATLLAAGLALTADGAGLRTLLVDADPLGGGASLAIGWDQVRGPQGRVALKSLTQRANLRLLSCGAEPGLPPETMAGALEDGARNCDLIVADLPRRLDEAATMALRAADRVLLVVPAETRACVAAARVAATIAPHSSATQIVVRDPLQMRSEHIGEVLRLPVAGDLRSERDLPGRLERGKGPQTKSGHLVGLCHQILDGLGLGPVSPEAGAAA